MPPNGSKTLNEPDRKIEKRQQHAQRHTYSASNDVDSSQGPGTRSKYLECSYQETAVRGSHRFTTEIKSSSPAKRKSEGSSSIPTSSVGPASAQSTSLTFHPAYCYSASPTWFTWVKLTAQDIHNRLREREGYQHVFQTGYVQHCSRSGVLFYLNHPIQFVQVVGVVVNLEEYFERFWLFTIDDSSGSTVDVVCKKPEVKREQGTQFWDGVATVAKHSESAEAHETEKEVRDLSRQVEAVQIGAVLQVKGTITLFQRHKATTTVNGLNNQGRTASTSVIHAQGEMHADQPIRQISLSRLNVILSTTDELSLIDARTDFRTSVLSKPWDLTQQQVQKLHRKALGDAEHERSRVRRHMEKDVRRKKQEEQHADQIQAEYEDEDRLRRHEADLARQAGEHLKTRRRRQQQQQQQQKSNNATVMNGASVALDERSALLRAAFG